MPLRSFTEAEIALMARRRLERPLLATLWLGAVMLGLAEGNLFYVLAGTFAVAVNLLAVEQRREVYVQRLWVNIGVLAALAILLLEVHARRVLLHGALAHFMILIQVCKLFERKSNRDYVQMLSLSVLTVVAAALYSQAMWFAMLLAAYLVLATYSAMILTLKQGLDTAAEARLACETAPLDVSRVAWNVIRDWPGRAVAGKLAAILAIMVVTGVVVFVVAPREELTTPGVLGGLGEAAERSGYSRELRLGQPRKVQLSDKIVMRVTCDDGSSALAGSLRYFRGKTMEGYSRSGWHDTSRSGLDLPPADSPLLAGSMKLAIAMEPSLLPDLFAPYPAVRWDTRGVGFRADDDLTASLYRGARTDRLASYTVYVLGGPLSAEQRAYLEANLAPDRTAPPSRSVEVTLDVLRLAREWCWDLLSAREADPTGAGQWNLSIAQRIAERLRAHCEYSLDLSSADPGRDGVEDFLFHMRRGHCEYFASALTVMCRALDVPARLATGFFVNEMDGSVGQYVVREWDAHAWTEVYVDGTGWVTVDATPPVRQELASRNWWRRLDAYWSRWSFYWYNRVVGYDLAVQRRVWDQLVSATKESLTNLLVYGYIDRAMERTSIALGLLATVLAGLLEGKLLLRIYRRRRQRRQAAAILAAQPWGALAFIPVLLDRLDPPAQADRTALEAARAAQRRLAVPAGPLEELVALYYRVRWGGCRPEDREVAAARRRADALAGLAAAPRRGRAGARKV